MRSQKALIEALGARDVPSALHLMGLVGLSDAFIYLKRFSELSTGQQYRAMLAQLIAAGHNVWLVDEFCASLDPIIANVVADRLRKAARRLKATLIVTASNCDHFLGSLQPDRVIQLTSAWEHRILSGIEARSEMPWSVITRIPRMPIKSDFLAAIRSGRKTTTIRRGRKDVSIGLLLLTARGESLPVTVTSVAHTRFRCLTEAHARNDGFDSLDDLNRTLRGFWPDIGDNSWVTVVSFTPPSTGMRERPSHDAR